MPGILPMKVIKIGASAQARIAQACDRCRSKKIRCDGIRPCCSQCSNVGFECKTSDKLSRRAFPRGYTEGLEERVRSLEGEVRELKDLLDEKDEKIDMLTKIHPQSSASVRPAARSLRQPSVASPTVTPSESGSEGQAAKEETFKVQQSPYLLENGSTDSYFAGTSSGKTFLDAFKLKVQEKGRSAAIINVDLLLSGTTSQQSNVLQTPSDSVEWKAPPRLFSDQMVNIFFQEWSPLFPVLHRPTFLRLYEKYTEDPESVTEKANLAQLNLVFGLAALSHGLHHSPALAAIEIQWQAAVKAIQTEQSMVTLQCLILAQLYCVQRGDYNKLLTYKALAISLSSRLGLHQSQKRFALDTLTCETRKKVFWTLYTVDSFSAVNLGLPKQLKDDDVHCEYPVDADDEYVTEQGFQPSLPGESTKLSSALALFRATRILSRVLEEVYPALPSYELSLQKLSNLAEDLDQWSASLPSHLRLNFAQDKPSTGTISSRSPLLSLTYHYIRSLIHRPATCASLGSRSSSSVMAMASSSKHVVQIVQLLAERGLSFSFCLNRDELLVLSGFGLLHQSLDLNAESKLMKDNQKTIGAIIGMLDKAKAASTSEFRRVACCYLPIPVHTPKAVSVASISRHNSDGAMPAPQFKSAPSGLRQHLKHITSKLVSPSGRTSKYERDHRRATEPTLPIYGHGLPSESAPSMLPQYSPSHVSQSEPALSPPNTNARLSATSSRPSGPQLLAPKRTLHAPNPRLNLDYFSFDDDQSPASTTLSPAAVPPPKTDPTDWERLLSSLDNGQTNIFDNIYGGPPMDFLGDTSRLKPAPATPMSSHSYSGISHKTSSPRDTHSSTSDLHRRRQTTTSIVNNPAPRSTSSVEDLNWSPDAWALTSADLAPTYSNSVAGLTESVFSFDTDDAFGSSAGASSNGSSGVDGLDGSGAGAGRNRGAGTGNGGAGGDAGSGIGSGGLYDVGNGCDNESFKGLVMPSDFHHEDGILDGWPNGIAL